MLSFLELVEPKGLGIFMHRWRAPLLDFKPGPLGLLGLVVGAWLCMGSACDPCVQLTNSICDCEPTANAQLACRQERELQRAQRDETSADVEVCAAALETCTCAAIENNDWAACGMTRDVVPETEELAEEEES